MYGVLLSVAMASQTNKSMKQSLFSSNIRDAVKREKCNGSGSYLAPCWQIIQKTTKDGAAAEVREAHKRPPALTPILPKRCRLVAQPHFFQPDLFQPYSNSFGSLT